MLEALQAGTGIILLLVIGLVVILTVITVSMSLRLTRLNKRYQAMMKGQDGQSLEKSFHNRLRKMEKIGNQTEENEKEIRTLKAQLGRTLTHYGIVKYDAFDDVGGKMSFALAMLDSENSGFILDTIHSKDNCFLYLKEIVKGESYIMLSNEEVEALKMAVSNTEEQNLNEMLQEN